jgi:hypothetical protein
MIAGAIAFAAFKIVFGLILIPARILAWGAAGLFEGIFFILKALAVVLLGGILLLLGLALLAVPLVSIAPILLLAGLCWIAWRAFRRPARVAAGS